jgi:exopolysaccharide production protein ExoZ
VTKRKIHAIEAARGLAALAVVLFHADTTVWMHAVQNNAPDQAPFAWGDRGVDFFFVLSGFIIVYAHQDETTGWRTFRRYAAKRFVRVYPVLWLVAGSVVTMNLLMDAQLPSAEQVTTSFLLNPSLAWGYPPVSWTLRHEVLFYALFSVSLLNRRLGLAILTVWFAACAAQGVALQVGASAPGTWMMVLSPLNLDFAIGALAALASRSISSSPGGLVVLAIGVAALATTFFGFALAESPSRRVLDYQGPAATLWDFLFGCSFGVIVLGLSQLGSRVPVPSFLLWLGSASYALYLVHTPVLGVAGRFTIDWLGSSDAGVVFAYCVSIGMALVAAWSIHACFERPVSGLLRSALLREGSTHLRKQGRPLKPLDGV